MPVSWARSSLWLYYQLRERRSNRRVRFRFRAPPPQGATQWPPLSIASWPERERVWVAEGERTKLSSQDFETERKGKGCCNLRDILFTAPAQDSAMRQQFVVEETPSRL
ncbi:hypothetical protein CDL15_Pgr001946 [Punica granatum]|uniref:Uncharacterized protein n=1 Tax=Punica granatum TaxID=22663 RepID=A0A218XDE4_PUNGR|nr:hypothetical protein CDL15_Pgr001946 [Punica granatum]